MAPNEIFQDFASSPSTSSLLSASTITSTSSVVQDPLAFYRSFSASNHERRVKSVLSSRSQTKSPGLSAFVIPRSRSLPLKIYKLERKAKEKEDGRSWNQLRSQSELELNNSQPLLDNTGLQNTAHKCVQTGSQSLSGIVDTDEEVINPRISLYLEAAISIHSKKEHSV